MNIGVVPMGYTWAGTGYDLTDCFGDGLDVGGRTAGWTVGDELEVAGLVYDYYLAIGSTDISNCMTDLKAIGFWPKVKDHPIPGTQKVIRTQEGVEGPGYQFNVWFNTDREAASAFLKMLWEIDDDTKLYNRDNLWYHWIKYAASAPLPLGLTTVFKPAVKVWLRDPYLYSAITQSWELTTTTLPQTSAAMDNYGHFKDGFESIAITGHYSSPNHVEDLVLSVAGGDSITLSSHLLSDEKITLLVDGQLTTEWTASIASLAAFQRDATTSGATFDTDHIVIGTGGGSAIVSLSGPWPTKTAVKMTASLAAFGAANVQVSTDAGATWTEAVAFANISNYAIATYYLKGSEKAADIQVKFNVPAGSALGIYTLKLERVLDCSGATLPGAVAGTTAAFTVSCDATKSTSVDIDAEYHPRRQAL